MKRVGIVSVVVMLMLALGGCGGERPNDENRSNPAPKNRPPVAAGASVQARDDGSYRITLQGSDPDGDALSYRILTPPSHGRLQGTAPVLRYLPEAGFTGEDRFTYSVSDGKLDSAPAEVTIRIKGRGDDNTSKGLRSLSLSVGTTSLNKDHNTTLSLTGTYADGTQKDLSAQAKWIVTPKDALKITGHTLTALKDVNVTLRAQVGKVLSHPVHLEIYWEVNGHRLPPEPAPKINNATLLGVDVNHNGVRDDVERWIYETYKDKHPIYIDIAMQEARADRLILEKQPKTKKEAMEIKDEVDKPVYCELYFRFDAEELGDPILVKDDITNEYFRSKIYFNTKERKEVYEKYDALLSGDSYTLLPVKEEKTACDFNTSKYEE